MNVNLGTLLLLAVALAADCFAASLALGVRIAEEDRRRRIAFALKAATIFGTMQGLMPLAGFLLASVALARITSWGPWIAAGLLVVVALDMFKEAVEIEREGRHHLPGHGPKIAGVPGWGTLAMLGLATSIDAFAVGFSLHGLDVRPWLTLALIALASLLFSLVGIWLGRIVRRHVGAGAEALGGMVLLAIALKILVDNGVFG